MASAAAYALAMASVNGDDTYVIVDESDALHVASSWLRFLTDAGKSPHTVRNYGGRVAKYLTWTAKTSDWRSISVSHLAMWRNVVGTEIIRSADGVGCRRTRRTVELWMIPLRSFYWWADSMDLLRTDVVARMTEVKYFPPGTAAGGEHGARRRVLTDALKPRHARGQTTREMEWIEDPVARRGLETLELHARYRFLIDLLYYTGIRVGEALSLFCGDMHFGGGSPELGCRTVDPHFHIVMGNDTENGARAKGAERTLHVTPLLVERYIDYVLERSAVLGLDDQSKHVFVNLYDRENDYLGRAMTYSNAYDLVKRVGNKIGVPLTRPHMLRHTFATRLVRGIDCDRQDLDVVQYLLGHRSIESTRLYTHGLEPAAKAALAALIPRAIELRPTK